VVSKVKRRLRRVFGDSRFEILIRPVGSVPAAEQLLAARSRRSVTTHVLPTQRMHRSIGVISCQEQHCSSNGSVGAIPCFCLGAMVHLQPVQTVQGM
jgi:hypothetical protein